MTFYLQQSAEDGRWMIDVSPSSVPERIKKSCEAVEWLDAKQKLGFDLSPIQAALLDKHNAKRAELAKAA